MKTFRPVSYCSWQRPLQSKCLTFNLLYCYVFAQEMPSPTYAVAMSLYQTRQQCLAICLCRQLAVGRGRAGLAGLLWCSEMEKAGQPGSRGCTWGLHHGGRSCAERIGARYSAHEGGFASHHTRYKCRSWDAPPQMQDGNVWQCFCEEVECKSEHSLRESGDYNRPELRGPAVIPEWQVLPGQTGAVTKTNICVPFLHSGLGLLTHSFGCCSWVLQHGRNNDLVWLVGWSSLSGILPGLLSGNCSDNWVPGAGVRSCFGNLQLLVQCHQRWELQAPLLLGKEKASSVSRLGQTTPPLQEFGGNGLQCRLKPRHRKVVDREIQCQAWALG